MRTSHDIMRERLLKNVMAEEFWPEADTQYHVDWKAMKDFQWNSKEWQHTLLLMENRMCMGGYRYGPTSQQKAGEFDNISDIHRRLDKYEKTGNMEHLVDAANITIIECLKKNHPNFHFMSIDDGEHAVRNERQENE